MILENMRNPDIQICNLLKSKMNEIILKIIIRIFYYCNNISFHLVAELGHAIALLIEAINKLGGIATSRKVQKSE
jgi:hypothetical protein